jgi:sugar phosphate permease
MAIGDTPRATWAVRMASRWGIYYGWLVVAVTFLALLVAAGVRQAPGVVIKPLEAEFGWDRASISFAVAISLLMYGLAGPFGGRMMDRFGPRRVMLWAMVLAVAGSAAMLAMSTLVELTLWWGVVVGLATGALAMVAGATVANRWFVARRGFVIGLLGAGVSAGQLIFLPAMMALTLVFDWRSAIGLMMGVLGIVVLPLGLLVLRDQPADVGLEAYGATAESRAEVAGGGLFTPLSQALRSGDFWLLSGSFFVCGFTSNGLIGTHFIPHAVEHGFTEYTAAGAMALIGAMNVVGTTMSGYLTDRYNPRVLLAIYYGFRAVSLVMLPLVSDILGLTVFAIMFGLDYIATVPPTAVLTADRFGRRSVGLLFGWISFSHQVGGAAAAYGGGLVYNYLGDYQVAFLAAGALGFIAAALSLRIAPRGRALPATA